MTSALLFAVAVTAAVYGVTYAYLLHYLVNGLAAWLVLLHWRHSPLSPAAFAGIIEADTREQAKAGKLRRHVHRVRRDLKKKP